MNNINITAITAILNLAPDLQQAGGAGLGIAGITPTS